jgi:hypothetical protein
MVSWALSTGMTMKPFTPMDFVIVVTPIVLFLWLLLIF